MSNPRPDLAPDESAPEHARDERPYAEPPKVVGLVDPSLAGYSASEIAVRVREEDALQCEYEAPAHRKLGGVMLLGGIYVLYYGALAAAVGVVTAIPAALFALAYFYVAFRTLFNKRRVRLGAEGLVARSGPLPWPGNSLNVPLAQLQEFRATSRRRAIDNAELWSLHAVRTDGRTIRAARDLGRRSEVEAITANFNATLTRLRGTVGGYR